PLYCNDVYGALIGRVVAHDAREKGTLPGAVLAGQRVKRAGLEGQGDVVESDQRAESLRHSGDREARWGDLGTWRGDAEMWGALETGPSHLETRRRGFKRRRGGGRQPVRACSVRLPSAAIGTAPGSAHRDARLRVSLLDRSEEPRDHSLP